MSIELLGFWYNILGAIFVQNYNEILKALREDHDMTQTELGKIFNLTQRQISTYETGRNEPPYNILRKYATYFSVSIDYILGLTNDPTTHWTIKNNLNFSGNNFGNITMN